MMSVKVYHFIGIGGIGVSAVARVLLQQGHSVQGSDVRESQLTEAMRGLGARVTIGHDPELINGADLVVYSTAVPKTNVELVEAKRRGVPCIHRSEALAHALEGLESVGVTGTHGKGTVSAMIAHGLICADLDPTFIIGGLLNQYKVNARVGRMPQAGDSPLTRCLGVAEVDESDGSHLNLNPHYVVVNNIEVDHLNYYDDLDDIVGTMARFINQNPNLKGVAVNCSDAGARSLIERLEPSARALVIRYGSDREALNELELSARALKDEGLRVRFDAYAGEERLGEVCLKTPGSYNAENAMAALSILRALGLSFEQIKSALESYEGLENRFTIREAGGVTIVKDYLSHPTGMRKVLDSAQRFGGNKIWCVFKPYRFTLMRYHANDYAEAFRGADEVLITTMYAANEPAIEGVDTPWFVEQLREAGNVTQLIPDQGDLVPHLQAHVSSGDLVFFFGGDDFFRMADAWADQRLAEV